MYKGENVKLSFIEEHILDLNFNNSKNAINKLDKKTIQEFNDAIEIAKNLKNINGMLITSGKKLFIAGADITEFNAMFKMTSDDIYNDITNSNSILSKLECLPFPTVSVINGFALGGGLELAMCSDYRTISKEAKIGLPEIKLGLIPGFGGTVRLPRLTNLGLTLQMIESGIPISADKSLSNGLVDAVYEPENLFEESIIFFKDLIATGEDWKIRRAKKNGVIINAVEQDKKKLIDKIRLAQKSFNSAEYAVLNHLHHSIDLNFEQALHHETYTFSKLSKTQSASSFVQLFLSEQHQKKVDKNFKTDAFNFKSIGFYNPSLGDIEFISTVILNGYRVHFFNHSDEFKKSFIKQLNLLDSKKNINKFKYNFNSDLVDFWSAELLIFNNYEDYIGIQKLNDSLGIDANIILMNFNPDQIDLIGNVGNAVHVNSFFEFEYVEITQSSTDNHQLLNSVYNFYKTLDLKVLVNQSTFKSELKLIQLAYVDSFFSLLLQSTSVEYIDNTLLNYGWKIGPAEYIDQIGLEYILGLYEVYGWVLNKDNVAVMNIIKSMINEGAFGYSNHSGFYIYEQNQKKPNLELLSKLKLFPNLNFDKHFIFHYFVLKMALFADFLLNQMKERSGFEVDFLYMDFLDFPKYLGGPLKNFDWLRTNPIENEVTKINFDENFNLSIYELKNRKIEFYQ